MGRLRLLSGKKEIYRHLHERSTAAGRAIPPETAVRGSLDWQEGEELHGFIEELAGEV